MKKAVILTLLLAPVFVGADSIPAGVFAVSPGKQEVKIEAGDKLVRNIYITNNLGYDAIFTVEVEDVAGGENGQTLEYFGSGVGPYSLKKYVVISSGGVMIGQGDVKTVPVMISVPVKTKPGGYYGAVFVSEQKTASGQARVTTRAGSLIFLRVTGPTIERGELRGFGTSKLVNWGSRPIEFSLSYSNSGNIYLNPYGLIEISDWRGRVISKIPVEPWFVLPDSTRERTIAWRDRPRLGFYRATLYLNYGYAKTKAAAVSDRFICLPFWFPILVILLFILIAAAKYRKIIFQWQT